MMEVMYNVIRTNVLKEVGMTRRIIHFDIDAFFASVEQLDYPEYRGKPLIVGGKSDRGVVATCSYEARKYGVRSAMSSVVAQKLCPQGIFVHGRMGRYQEISVKIFKYIEEKFEHVERVSIDEAYIDVTCEKETTMEIACQIKNDIHSITGLTISVGISYNKFLAKLASDWKKPDGIFEIKSRNIPDILMPLPIIKIHGLGKKTCERLNRIGIFTIEDLYQYPESLLGDILGESWSKEIVQRIHGIDQRQVIENHTRKSYGKETTLSEDTIDRTVILSILEDYLTKIHTGLSKRSLTTKTLTIKIKYYDFEQFTKSHSLDYHTNNFGVLNEALQNMFTNLQLVKPVRLVGLTASNLESEAYKQFNLLEENPEEFSAK